MSEPRSKVLFTDLPIPNQEIVRGYLFSLNNLDLEAALVSYVIDEINHSQSDYKEIINITQHLQENAEQVRQLLKYLEWAKKRMTNQFGSMHPDDVPASKNHWEALQKEIENFDVIDFVKIALGINSSLEWEKSKTIKVTFENVTAKFNCILPESHWQIIFSLVALKNKTQQRHLFEKLIDERRFDFNNFIILFLKSGMQADDSFIPALERLLEQLLSVDVSTQVAVLEAILANSTVAPLFCHLEDLSLLIESIMSQLVSEKADAGDEKKEFTKSDVNPQVLNILERFSHVLDPAALNDLNIEEVIHNACELHNYEAMKTLIRYCRQPKDLTKMLLWAIDHLDPDLFEQYAARYPVRNEMTLRLLDPTRLIQLLKSREEKAKQILKIILREFNKIPIVHASIIVKLIKNERDLTAEEFYNCLDISINRGDIILAKMLIALDEAKVFSSVSWLDSSANSSLLLKNLLKNPDTEKSAALILDYRRRHPTPVASLDEKSELETYLNKYHAVTVEELIAMIPEICIDTDALKCILYNTFGYPDREEALSSRFLKKDVRGRILLHYLVELPEEENCLLSQVLNFEPRERDIKLSVSIADQQGITPIHLAAQSASKNKLHRLWGDDARKLNFNLDITPTPIDLLYACGDVRKIRRCMEILLPASSNTKDYFFRQYGPEVETFTPQEQEKLAEQWFPFRFTAKSIVNLDYLLQFQTNAESVKKILEKAREVLNQSFSNENRMAFLRVYRRINFNLLSEEKNDFHMDAASANTFACGNYLTTLPFPEAQLTALDCYSELLSKYPHVAQNVLNRLLPKISVENVRSLFEKIFGVGELKQHSNNLSTPLTLTKIAKRMGFQNEETVSVVTRHYCRLIKDSSALFQKSIDENQINLAQLMIRYGGLLQLPPNDSQNYLSTLRQIFSRIFQHNRADVIDDLLDRGDGYFINLMKAFGQRNLDEREPTPLHSLINLLCRHQYYPQLIKVLSIFTPPSIRNKKLSTAFDRALVQNNINLLGILANQYLSPESILRGLQWAIDNKNPALFQKLLRNAKENQIDIFKNSKQISTFISQLYQFDQPWAKEMLKNLTRTEIFPPQFKHIGIVIANKAYGDLTTPIAETDFFKLIQDLYIPIQFSKTPTAESAAIETLLALDASGAFGKKHFNSWRGTFFLKNAFDDDNKIILAAILNYRDQFSLRESKSEAVALDAKLSVKETTPTSVVYPEPFFQKYQVKTIEQLIEKIPEISSDVSAVINIIFNTCGYHDREMLLKMQLTKVDHAGRNILHYLVEDNSRDAKLAIAALLDVIMPESRINGFLETKDQSLRTPIHLAAQNGDLLSLAVLCGNDARALNFDVEKFPNPIHSAYQCADEKSVLPCVTYIINHSRSAKEYFFNQFGPDVPAAEYKTKCKKWFSALNPDLLDTLIKLDAAMNLTKTLRSQVTKKSLFRNFNEPIAINHWDPVLQKIKIIYNSDQTAKEKLTALKKLMEDKTTPALLKETLKQTSVFSDITLPVQVVKR